MKSDAKNAKKEVGLNQVDSNGTYVEERVIYGPTLSTPDLHNISAKSHKDCHKLGDGKWCFKRTDLFVATPNSKWVFAGAAYVDLVEDNQGSAGWNLLGAPDRFFITLNNPNEVQAYVLTGSRSIKVRLACTARYYPG